MITEGQQERNCVRTACKAPGATWWNRSTRAWYCKPCAMKINDQNGEICHEGEPYSVQGLIMVPDTRSFYDRVEEAFEYGRVIHVGGGQLAWNRTHLYFEYRPGRGQNVEATFSTYTEVVDWLIEKFPGAALVVRNPS